MNRQMKFVIAVAGTAAIALLTANLLEAKAPFVKKAKEAGFEVKDCSYCHVTPKGGKELNDRGTWLKAQKAEKKAEAVDMTWLKDYKEAPKK